MNKKLKLPVRFTKLDISQHLSLELLIEPAALNDWCLLLTLLKENLVSGITVASKYDSQQIEIELFSALKTNKRKNKGPIVYRSPTLSFAKNSYKLVLPQWALDATLGFFLKYVRDNVAEVDHLDLEVESNEGGPESYMTFQVLEFAPPLSPEEVKKKIGL